MRPMARQRHPSWPRDPREREAKMVCFMMFPYRFPWKDSDIFWCSEFHASGQIFRMKKSGAFRICWVSECALPDARREGFPKLWTPTPPSAQHVTTGSFLVPWIPWIIASHFFATQCHQLKSRDGWNPTDKNSVILTGWWKRHWDALGESHIHTLPSGKLT